MGTGQFLWSIGSNSKGCHFNGCISEYAAHSSRTVKLIVTIRNLSKCLESCTRLWDPLLLFHSWCLLLDIVCLNLAFPVLEMWMRISGNLWLIDITLDMFCYWYLQHWSYQDFCRCKSSLWQSSKYNIRNKNLHRFRVTRKHWPPVRRPPLRTGYSDCLRNGARTALQTPRQTSPKIK